MKKGTIIKSAVLPQIICYTFIKRTPRVLPGTYLVECLQLCDSFYVHSAKLSYKIELHSCFLDLL